MNAYSLERPSGPHFCSHGHGLSISNPCRAQFGVAEVELRNESSGAGCQSAPRVRLGIVGRPEGWPASPQSIGARRLRTTRLEPLPYSPAPLQAPISGTHLREPPSPQFSAFEAYVDPRIPGQLVLASYGNQLSTNLRCLCRTCAVQQAKSLPVIA
jgi:hypothetical protein